VSLEEYIVGYGCGKNEVIMMEIQGLFQEKREDLGHQRRNLR